jgi:putative acetyltransferase
MREVVGLGGGEYLHDMEFLIRKDDLDGPEIVELLQAHLDHAATHSPPESIHALDLDRLRAPEITFWSVWSDGALLGCGALKELAPDHGEIKSMHTARAHRGKGVAARLLTHILEEAKARTYRRVSLETGTMAGFAPARALYERFGFRVCAPFAQYREDPNNVCMTLDLQA